LEEFFELTELFSKKNLEDIPQELAIITNAGGLGVLATDAVEKYGIFLTEFTQEEKDILKNGLPINSISNPIDIL
jgi:acetyltransferase